MDDFLNLREEQLKAEHEKAVKQLQELQSLIMRIEGALVMVGELKAKLAETK